MHTDVDQGTGLLSQVCEGMEVFDGSGERIGKVTFIKMGDSTAVTTQGNETTGLGGLAAPASAGAVAVGGLWGATSTEPDVPEPRRSHLLRVGYMKVDRSGFMAGDSYVAADEIVSVQDERVCLAPAGQSAASTHVPPGSFVTATPTPAPTPHPAPTPMPAWTEQPADSSSGFKRGFVIAPAAGVVLATAAWQYRRWRREQSRPINRFRRGARHIGQRVTKRLPDRDQVMARVPEVDAPPRRIGAVALTTLALGWLVRNRLSARSEDSSDRMSAIVDAVPSMPEDARSRQPWLLGGGLAGAGLVLTALALIWRTLRQEDDRPTYIGTPGIESALGRDRTLSGEFPPEMGVERV